MLLTELLNARAFVDRCACEERPPLARGGFLNQTRGPPLFFFLNVVQALYGSIVNSSPALSRHKEAFLLLVI